MNEELFKIGMKKDRGLKRKDKPNQDSIKVVLPPAQSVKPPLLILSDGMGGYGGGEIASDTTVRTIEATYLSTPDQAMTIEELMTLCINDALGELRKIGATDEKLSWMGCTVVMAALYPDKLVIANVGDSRAYQISGAGDITQISYDHSFVAEQLRHGLITEEEAQNHPRKNVLSMSLSARREGISPYVASFPWEAGDSVLLCSDGLWGPVSEDQIESVVSELSPQAATEKLIQKANENKGPDNISIIIAKYHQAASDPSDMTIAPESASLSVEPEKAQDAQPRRRPIWVILGVVVLALIAFLTSWKIETDRRTATATAEAMATATERANAKLTATANAEVVEATFEAAMTEAAIVRTKAAIAEVATSQAVVALRVAMTEVAIAIVRTETAIAEKATSQAATAHAAIRETARVNATATAEAEQAANATEMANMTATAVSMRATDARYTITAVFRQAYANATATALAQPTATLTPTVTPTPAATPTETQTDVPTITPVEPGSGTANEEGSPESPAP